MDQRRWRHFFQAKVPIRDTRPQSFRTITTISFPPLPTPIRLKTSSYAYIFFFKTNRIIWDNPGDTLYHESSSDKWMYAGWNAGMRTLSPHIHIQVLPSLFPIVTVEPENEAVLSIITLSHRCGVKSYSPDISV